MSQTLVGSALGANGYVVVTRHAQRPLQHRLLLSLTSQSPNVPSQSPVGRRTYSQPSLERRQPQSAVAASIPSSAITPSPSSTSPPRPLATPSATANPPATTRPPTLTLPARPPEAINAPFFSPANFKHLFATGVAYAKFYKAGIKQIYTNTRLLYPPRSSSSPSPNNSSSSISSSSSSSRKANEPPPQPPAPHTRAHHLLRARWLHDVRRLPLFAVILLVCGELTPLVVLALPRAVPLTCRIPRQVDKLLATAEARRAEARREAAHQTEKAAAAVPASVLARVLGLPARAWTPGFVLRRRVEARLAFLARDDKMLAEAGGAEALVADEVRLACVDRGVDVRGRGDEELRGALARWLRATERAARIGGEEARVEVMRRLLLVKDSEWEV